MARLILHIGQTKTATTTIQDFLHRNQKTLAGSKIHYLGRPYQAKSHRYLFHALQLETFTDSSQITRVALKRLKEQGLATAGQQSNDVCDQAWSLVEASMPGTDDNTALLSEELLWHLGGFRKKRRLPLLHTLRRRLLNIIDPGDLMIVACLRHHADWAESWHNQLVKDTGNQTPISKFVPYLSQEGAFRYAENLADWRAVFPEAEFVVKDFYGSLLAAEQPPGLALLNVCGVLEGLSSKDQDLLTHPEPLQEAIHPFVHHWITRHQPPKGSSLKQYKRTIRRLSRQIGRVAERRFGAQRFTILTPNLAVKLTNWSQDDPLAEVLGSTFKLLSRITERRVVPRPLPRRVRELCAEGFNLS